MRGAALGPLTPPLSTGPEQHWATYDPVRLPDPDAALKLLGAPGRWPDIGCAGGRFTPLRGGGLLGRTFEIEVVAEPAPRFPDLAAAYKAAGRAAQSEFWGPASPERSMLGQLARVSSEGSASPTDT